MSNETHKPDLDDVEELGTNEGVYQRDSDGELQPLDWEVLEINGEYRKVRFYPIPIGDHADFRELGDDVEMNALLGILSEKVASPDRTVDEWRDTDPTQVMAFLSRLTELANGSEPSNEFHAEIQEELEEHHGSGN